MSRRRSGRRAEVAEPTTESQRTTGSVDERAGEPNAQRSSGRKARGAKQIDTKRPAERGVERIPRISQTPFGFEGYGTAEFDLANFDSRVVAAVIRPVKKVILPVGAAELSAMVGRLRSQVSGRRVYTPEHVRSVLERTVAIAATLASAEAILALRNTKFRDVRKGGRWAKAIGGAYADIGDAALFESESDVVAFEGAVQDLRSLISDASAFAMPQAMLSAVWKIFGGGLTSEPDRSSAIPIISVSPLTLTYDTSKLESPKTTVDVVRIGKVREMISTLNADDIQIINDMMQVYQPTLPAKSESLKHDPLLLLYLYNAVVARPARPSELAGKNQKFFTLIPSSIKLFTADPSPEEIKYAILGSLGLIQGRVVDTYALIHVSGNGVVPISLRDFVMFNDVEEKIKQIEKAYKVDRLIPNSTSWTVYASELSQFVRQYQLSYSGTEKIECFGEIIRVFWSGLQHVIGVQRIDWDLSNDKDIKASEADSSVRIALARYYDEVVSTLLM